MNILNSTKKSSHSKTLLLRILMLFVAGPAPGGTAPDLGVPDSGHKRGQGAPLLSDIILSPGIPPTVPPPTPPPDQLEQDHLRRLERRKAGENSSPNGKGATGSMKARLEQESLRPSPLNMLFALVPSYPIVRTKGALKSYSVDPTMIFHMSYRIAKSTPENLDRFFGLRIAPFSGKGVIQEHAATYGFVYFGPMVGVGNIRPRVVGKSQGNEAESIGPHGEEEEEGHATTGWMFWGGIAAQSRLTAYDRGGGAPDADLRSKGLALDSPGLWAEVIYTSLHYNAIGIEWLGGVQMGKNKTFLYAGLGIGLWN